MKNIIFLAICLAKWFINVAHGHGMMLSPVARGSRWRYNKSAPIDYDDNAGFCGGFGVRQ